MIIDTVLLIFIELATLKVVTFSTCMEKRTGGDSTPNGVSEASVKAAAGWLSGAMVSRCTKPLSGELAIEEFSHSWK